MSNGTDPLFDPRPSSTIADGWNSYRVVALAELRHAQHAKSLEDAYTRAAKRCYYASAAWVIAVMTQALSGHPETFANLVHEVKQFDPFRGFPQ